MRVQNQIIDRFIREALAEDLGAGDHTTNACIPDDHNGAAFIVAKDSGIAAGVEMAIRIYHTIDPGLDIEQIHSDGDPVNIGGTILRLEGSSRTILKGERLVLNCMQRMSGIATHTNRFVKAVEGFRARILDTRKTTPNFRYFEKWAVRIGGGHNHRMGLYDMILIKDNHVDFAGGIGPAIMRAVAYAAGLPAKIPIEIEARTIGEVREVLEAGKVDRILLDNFDPPELANAVALINGRFETEASGNVTLENVRQMASSGVDSISIGALTHSAPNFDISLRVQQPGIQ